MEYPQNDPHQTSQTGTFSKTKHSKNHKRWVSSKTTHREQGTLKIGQTQKRSMGCPEKHKTDTKKHQTKHGVPSKKTTNIHKPHKHRVSSKRQTPNTTKAEVPSNKHHQTAINMGYPQKRQNQQPQNMGYPLKRQTKHKHWNTVKQTYPKTPQTWGYLQKRQTPTQICSQQNRHHPPQNRVPSKKPDTTKHKNRYPRVPSKKTDTTNTGYTHDNRQTPRTRYPQQHTHQESTIVGCPHKKTDEKKKA